MLMFFITFIVIGFLMGVLIKDEGIAFLVILAVTVFWAFSYGPWAIATFIELFIGYSMGSGVRGR
jgi:hypothetical protein